VRSREEASPKELQSTAWHQRGRTTHLATLYAAQAPMMPAPTTMTSYCLVAGAGPDACGSGCVEEGSRGFPAVHHPTGRLTSRRHARDMSPRAAVPYVHFFILNATLKQLLGAGAWRKHPTSTLARVGQLYHFRCDFLSAGWQQSSS
jgi:hypothetical protein